MNVNALIDGIDASWQTTWMSWTRKPASAELAT
jgi:hypothetical protein